jgi:quinol monooxygenase YgiN
MALFGLSGRIDAIAGHGDELAALLQEAATVMDDVDGCLLYLVSRVADAPDAVVVVEVWRDREAHAASLQLEAVRDVIGRAAPVIAGMTERVELEPIGAAGLPL